MTIAIITEAGVRKVAPLVVVAQQAAAAAQGYAAAAAALMNGKIAASQGAGEAITTTGQYFVVFPGTGAMSVYVRTGGGSTLVASMPVLDLTTSQLLSPNGSAAAPSISFINDPDCGWYRVGTNSFAAATNGAQRMVFAAAGEVSVPGSFGMGTASPAYAADIHGPAVGNNVVQPLLQIKSDSDSSSNAVEMLLTTRVSGQTRTAIGARREGSGATAQLYFATDNVDRMIIGGDGLAEHIGQAVGNNVVQVLGRLRSLSDALSNAVEMQFSPLVSGQSRTAVGASRDGAGTTASLYFATNNTVRLLIGGGGAITIPGGLSNYANDAAASGGGIAVGGLYRNGSVVMIRVS